MGWTDRRDDFEPIEDPGAEIDWACDTRELTSKQEDLLLARRDE